MSGKVDKEKGILCLLDLLEENDQHARKHQRLYQKLRKGQTPKIVLVFCSDSRLQTCMFGDSLKLVNKVFVGRDLGNTYEENEGAVDYAVKYLGVSVVFILGHTHCGDCKVAGGDYSQESAAIRQRLAHLQVDHNEKKSPQANVDAQVKFALESYREKVHSGELVILGGIFDLVGYYGKTLGKIYLTNINGETREKAIRHHLSQVGLLSAQVGVKRL